MIPRRALVANAAILIGGDVVNLAQPTPFVAVALVKAPFTPSPDISMGLITLADFNGSTPLPAASAATEIGVDPANGDFIMRVRTPAGDWRWITGSTLNLPQTIFGYLLLSADLSTIIASELLPAPVTLTITGNEVIVENVTIRLPLSAMS